jgi:hypothetical protein
LDEPGRLEAHLERPRSWRVDLPTLICQRRIMGSYWNEPVGIYGVSLLIASFSVMAAYGVLDLALAAGRALLH